MQVLVSTVGGGGTKQEESVETDADTAGARAGGSARGGGAGGLGGRVAGLVLLDMDTRIDNKFGGGGWGYLALENTNLQSLEDLAGLVAVADIFKGLGGILAADVEEDFLTTTNHDELAQFFHVMRSVCTYGCSSTKEETS